jgi:hypothetical protein
MLRAGKDLEKTALSTFRGVPAYGGEGRAVAKEEVRREANVKGALGVGVGRELVGTPCWRIE